MKRFVLVHHGYLPPTPSAQAAWDEWLERRRPSIADVGHAFGPGRLVTAQRAYELTLASNPASGYAIVWAPHLDAAEQLLEGCPIADSVSFYEALNPRPNPTDPTEQPKATDR
ncbi:MAG: hypothetical protein AAF480_01910 [Actinomycetota bacterium]